MYEYLEEHAYISENKKSNYQFELTRERAECIANKYNSLCEEKDKEIERLNSTIDELEKAFKEDIKTLKGYGEDSTMKTSDMINACQFYLDRLYQLKGVDKE